MAASNSSQAPFLFYLTVFKARLGAVNLVLRLTSLGYTPTPTLERQLKVLLTERVQVPINETSQRPFVEYLKNKKLLGDGPKKRARYADWSWANPGQGVVAHRGVPTDSFSAFRVDLWFADPRMPSTIGVPTPENATELIELAHQLRLITRTKNSHTAAGQLSVVLRDRAFLGQDADNPFLLGVQAVGLLRQLISEDGLMMVEILRTVNSQPERFTRDQVAKELPACARRAYKRAQELRFTPPALAAAREFVKLLDATLAKFGGEKGGPGVLEHRTAPRLEWLTDLGALSKGGLPKNGFEYITTTDSTLLFNLVDASIGQEFGAEDAAHKYWCSAAFFRAARKGLSGKRALQEALRESYGLLKRPVGPAPIREVVFLALILRGDPGDSMQALVEKLIEWAASERSITLSGGRYSRSPEFLHMTPAFLSE